MTSAAKGCTLRRQPARDATRRCTAAAPWRVLVIGVVNVLFALDNEAGRGRP